MSRFLKIVLGSCLGSLIAVVMVPLILISVFASKASSVAGESKPVVKANTILYFDMEKGIPELTGNIAISGFDFENKEAIGLHDLIRALKEAAKDDNIKGLYLRNMSVPAPLTTSRALRNAVLEFKESGKFVLAYAPYYEQSGYYLASTADKVYLGPLGIVDFRGLGAEVPYFKNALDKAGIKMEVFKVGDYKSAVEPFLRSDMSPENREQTKIFLEDLFGTMLADISRDRGISVAKLRQAADEMAGWKDEAAMTDGLVDGILTQTEIDRLLHDQLGLDYDKSLTTMSVDDYFRARLSALKGGKQEIAVLIAEGSIVDGKGDAGSIGDKKYVKEIDKLTKDKDVKAVVLRVNSGGGSASSSENIWYAMERLKEAGKPVVVSMGDYAASGGYYIAAGADKIIAEPTTITGSIGVFTTFPILKELMNDKIGINFDTVNTSRNSTALSTFQDITPEQRAVLTSRSGYIYQQFMQRVADGRKMPVKRVEEIAGGRVYSGNDALDLGLVDELGSLDEAVLAAADLAGLGEDYQAKLYPGIKPALERFIEDLLGMGGDDDIRLSDRVLRQELGEEYFQHYRLLRDMSQAQGVQARLPLVVRF